MWKHLPDDTMIRASEIAVVEREVGNRPYFETVRIMWPTKRGYVRLSDISKDGTCVRLDAPLSDRKIGEYCVLVTCVEAMDGYMELDIDYGT